MGLWWQCHVCVCVCQGTRGSGTGQQYKVHEGFHFYCCILDLSAPFVLSPQSLMFLEFKVWARNDGFINERVHQQPELVLNIDFQSQTEP